ncbi:MAG: MqnA/MqnD/SBP family protein [Porphyromonas pasteri]
MQSLNDEALKGTYEATAISFALYPLICDEYALLRTAVSFGEGYGPKLVKKKGAVLKRNFKVALSGKHTTNALLFRMTYPQARIVYKNFLITLAPNVFYICHTMCIRSQYKWHTDDSRHALAHSRLL